MRTGDGGRPRDPLRTRMLPGAVVAVMGVIAVPGMAEGDAAAASWGLVAAVAAAEEAAAGPAACRGGEPGAGCRHCTVQKDTCNREHNDDVTVLAGEGTCAGRDEGRARPGAWHCGASAGV